MNTLSYPEILLLEELLELGCIEVTSDTQYKNGTLAFTLDVMEKKVDTKYYEVITEIDGAFGELTRYVELTYIQVWEKRRFNPDVRIEERKTTVYKPRTRQFLVYKSGYVRSDGGLRLYQLNPTYDAKCTVERVTRDENGNIIQTHQVDEYTTKKRKLFNSYEESFEFLIEFINKNYNKSIKVRS